MPPAQTSSAGAAAAAPATPRMRADWPAVKAWFDRLEPLPAAEREQALAAADAPPAVREEVRALLAQHDAQARAEDDFLEAAPALPKSTDRRGQTLGPWRFGARLGAGGMGEVWEARRCDGAYDLRVAIKVLREGFGSGELLERFAQEQRQLARLNHPHIARLLDAGRTEDDRPCFVMEAVDGRPIDEACRGAPLPQRIVLFLQLADAVAHAHRQGLIHRDLKPANVLVTADGQVKLLDFGIAQALERHADTAHGPRPLTPGYASPEQVRGEPVGEASDVYALGVLLHVMLTGARPYGRASTTAQAALRAVLTEPPTPPSRMPAAPATAPDAGVARTQLRGDLDAIVLKALAKPVDRRYPTVAALVADLNAWRDGHPVAARAGGLVYRAGRFMRRHGAASAAAAVAGLALVGALLASAWGLREGLALLALLALGVGLGVSAWQARRAAAARDAAAQRLAQTQGLVRDIVQRHADLVTFLPGGLKVKAELLADALRWLERADPADEDAALTGERAKAHARLADLNLPGLDTTLDDAAAAGAHAERALALFPLGEAAHHRDPTYALWWARAWRARTQLLRQAGDAAAALAAEERRADLLRNALQRFAGDDDLRFEAVSSLVQMAQAYDTWFQGHLSQPHKALAAYDEAEARLRELMASRPTDGDIPYQLGTVAGGQQITLRNLGRRAESADRGRQAVAWREQALALDPQHTSYREGLAGECNNLALVLLEIGAVDEAVQVTGRGESVLRALIAEDPGTPTWAQRQRWFALHRGRALLRAGRAAEAIPRLEEALLAMTDVATPVLRRRRAQGRMALGQALLALGRAGEARVQADAAEADLEAAQAALAGDADTLALRAELAGLLRAMN